MIQTKVRAFKNEIRRRGQSRRMQKVRYMYWLEENTRYDELLQTFLYLVGSAKLHSESPSPASVSQIGQFLSRESNDWNIYVLICQQISQMDLMTQICRKVREIELVCQLATQIILRPLASIQNEEWKQIVGDTWRAMMGKCGKALLERMIQQLLECTPICSSEKGEWQSGGVSSRSRDNNNSSNYQYSNNNNTSSNNRIIGSCANTRERDDTIDRIVTIVAYVATNNNPQHTEQGQFYHLVWATNCSLIIALIQYLTASYWQMSQELIKSYLETIRFLNVEADFSNFADKYQTGTQMKNKTQFRHETSVSILQLLSLLFMPEDQTQYRLGVPLPDSLICLKMLAQVEIPQAKYLPLIFYAIQKSRNHEQTLMANTYSLNLLYKVSQSQTWLCYSHIRKYLIMVMCQIKLQFHQQGSLNIFHSPSYSSSPIKPSACLVKLQILLVNCLTNILKNEYDHSCDFEYNEMLSQMVEDILCANILEDWCQNWRIVESFQHLIVLLLNCRNQHQKLQLLTVCRRVLKWGSVAKQASRKIALYLSLYRLQNHEDYLGDSLQLAYDSEQSSGSDEANEAIQNDI